MPEICRFFGIIITINYDEHPPPHFHVRYESQRALIEIGSLDVYRGRLSPRVYSLVSEWAEMYQDELMDNWNRSQRQAPLRRIPPLE